MAGGTALVPGGRGWLVATSAAVLVGGGLLVLTAWSLASGGGVPGVLVLAVVGALCSAAGVAGLLGGLRVEARHHAVAALRPHDDVVEVSLGDAWPDALRAAGVDPAPVGVALLRHVTAAVGDDGIGLWSGGGTPTLVGHVPWSAVPDVTPGASTTVNGASEPAVALAVRGGEPLLLVPRRGASGNRWGAPDDVARLAARWAAGAWGTSPAPEDGVAGGGDAVPDDGVAPEDDVVREDDAVREDDVVPDAADARDAVTPSTDVPPTAAGASPPPVRGESVDERVRRLSGR